ncbi:TPA: hypothetical protein OL930_002825 [Proteus mirabilis]|nr:hypothetical protein [Proteus mirabilis]
MNIDIDSFALYIGVKAEYLAMLYRTTCELEGLPLPKRNRHGKVKMSEVLIFKQHFEDKTKKINENKTLRTYPKRNCQIIHNDHL